jgi:hypothetical protein
MSSVLDIACPHDGCTRQFGSDRALRIHVESAHADDFGAIERVREGLHMEEQACPIEGCSRAAGHTGRHSGQSKAASTKPKPEAGPNGQMVRVTLTVPLADLLKIATVESASL